MRKHTAFAACALLLTGHAFALPQDGNVAAGDVTFNQPDGNTLNILQGTDRAIINWQSFDIGNGENVLFTLPDGNSISLNRVLGGNASEIYGNLSSNGTVFLLNPQGVMFGAGSSVDVGSLLATTGNITDNAFLNGDSFTFNNAGGAITNNGTISTPGGYTVLAAPNVANNGVITARLGTVQLAGGKQFTLDPVGDGLISFAPNPADVDIQVANTGTVRAEGGTIALTTQQAEAAMANVINTSGLIEANTFQQTNGRIILGNQASQHTIVAGRVNANGVNTGESGGAVAVLGDFVDVRSGARIAANGRAGGGQVNVGGNLQGNGPLPNADKTYVAEGATLSTNATENGDGGNLIVWADTTTLFRGRVESRGGANSGDGGFIEVSGKQNLVFAGHADTRAPHGNTGMLLLDPVDIMIADGTGAAEDAELSDGEILEGDGGGTFTISEDALESVLAATDVTLEASNDITMADLTDDTLSLATTGNVVFTADSDGNGNGAFNMNAGDTIATTGANLTIGGDTLDVGGLATNLTDAAGGNIVLNTTGGNGAITLNGNLNTEGGNITVNGVSTLADDIALSSNSGDGTFTFNGVVNGDYILSMAAGGGDVSLVGTDVDTLTFLSGNGLSVEGTILTDSAQDYSTISAITLADTTTFTADDGGTATNITFDANNTIDGNGDLTLNGADITLGGTVGGGTPVGVITVNADGTLNMAAITGGEQTYNAGGGITTNGAVTANSGNITFADAVTLASNLTANAVTGNLTFDDTVNGTFTLNVAAANGAVNLNALVGGATPLNALIVNGATFSANGASTGGAQTYTGAGTIQGGYLTTGGNIQFNNAIDLANTTQINTTDNNVTFAGTVNGAEALTINAGTGAATFSDAVGGATALAQLMTNSNNTTTNGVTTDGLQSYTGTATVNGDLTSNNAGITFNGPAILGANSTFTSGLGVGDDITFASTLGGGYTLALVAGLADISFGDDVTTGALTFASGDDVMLAGDLLTSGDIDFTGLDDIVMTDDIAFAAGAGANDILMDADNDLTGAFNATLNGNNVTLGTVSGVNDLTLIAANANTLANAININGAVDITGATNLATDITTSGDAVSFNDALSLSGHSAVATAGGAIAFADTIDGGFNLTADSGGGANVTFGGIIGGVTPLADVTINTNIFNGQAMTLNGNLDITANNLTLAATTVGNGITLTGPATINGPLTAGTDLTIAGDINLGADLNAGNHIDIDGALTLTANSTITNGGLATDTFDITGNVDGDYAFTLSGGASDIAFTGDADVDAFTLASGNDFIYGGGTIEADSGIDISSVSHMLLAADTNLYGRDGATRADVSAGSSNIILASNDDVDLNIYGNIVTLYQIGDQLGNELGSLTVDANIAQMLGEVYTSGEQTINAQEGLAGFLFSAGGDVILNTAANLVGDINIQTNGGNIEINQPLNGGYAMNLDAATGIVSVNAALGDSTPLTNMTITAQLINLTSPITTTGDQRYTGETNLATALTITNGSITYDDPLILAGNSTLDVSGGNGTITFNDEVRGGYDLSLISGGLGNIVFNDIAGTAENRLGTLSIESAHDITFTQGVYATNYYQSRIDGLASFGFTPGLDVSNDIAVAVSQGLAGKFTGNTITLEAGDAITGEVYAREGLTIISNRTLLSGSIRGESGRDGARVIQLGSFSGGPHYFGGQNLPIVDDFYALPNLVARNLSAPTSRSGMPLPFTDATDAALNPFAALPTLVLAENNLIAPVDGMPTSALTPLFPETE